MRKTLLTLTTVGLLAVPAGMALAQSDTTEPTGPVPTCVDREQDRDRDRDRDCTVDQTCSGTQEQERTRTRLHEETGERAGVQEGAGDGLMHRRGALGVTDSD